MVRMRKRSLGEGGPRVGAIGLGCMGMSWAYPESGRDENESVATIHEAIATKGVVAWCGQHGAAFIPFSPLGRGFLAGAVDSETTFEESYFRSQLPRFTTAARTANARIVDLVREVASLHEATAAQVALMASSPAIAGRRPHTHREAQALIQLSHGGVVVIAVEQRQP